MPCFYLQASQQPSTTCVGTLNRIDPVRAATLHALHHLRLRSVTCTAPQLDRIQSVLLLRAGAVRRRLGAARPGARPIPCISLRAGRSICRSSSAAADHPIAAAPARSSRTSWGGWLSYGPCLASQLPPLARLAPAPGPCVFLCGSHQLVVAIAGVEMTHDRSISPPANSQHLGLYMHLPQKIKGERTDRILSICIPTPDSIFNLFNIISDWWELQGDKSVICFVQLLGQKW